jgi:hypothetical protein
VIEANTGHLRGRTPGHRPRLLLRTRGNCAKAPAREISGARNHASAAGAPIIDMAAHVADCMVVSDNEPDIHAAFVIAIDQRDMAKGRHPQRGQHLRNEHCQHRAVFSLDDAEHIGAALLQVSKLMARGWSNRLSTLNTARRTVKALLSLNYCT